MQNSARILIWCLSLLAGLLLSSHCHAKDLTISESGYKIVISGNATSVSRFAAGELQNYLHKITGIEYPIVTSDTVTGGTSGKLLLVGPSELTRDLMPDMNKLYREGFVIKVVGDSVVMLGDDAAIPVPQGQTIPFNWLHSRKGTLFAVYEFLERFGDVRWFWPGPDGEIVPKGKKLIVDRNTDILEKPDFQATRYYWNILSGVPLSTEQAHESTLWKLRLRFGCIEGSQRLPGGNAHSWSTYTEGDKYFKAHPEYYALVSGNRQAYQVCTSNPEVVRLFVEKIRERHSPSDRLTVSISPNDGHGFCECDKCRALDHPERYGSGENLWRDDRPVLSDRLMTFANAVAKEVKKTHPYLTLGILAYTYNFTPPKSIDRLEDNIMINISQASMFFDDTDYKRKVREAIEGWSRITRNIRVSEHYGDYEFSSQLITRKIAEELPFLKSKGCTGLLTQGPEYLAPNHLDYYVLARYMWNSDTKLDDLLNDYYGKAYGGAAGKMEKYFQFMEQHFDSVVSGWAWGETMIPLWWDQETIKKGYQYLDDALSAADSEGAIKRVQFIRTGHEFTDRITQFFRSCQQLGEAGFTIRTAGGRRFERSAGKPVTLDEKSKRVLVEDAYSKSEALFAFLDRHSNTPGLYPNQIYFWNKLTGWREKVNAYHALLNDTGDKTGIVFREDFNTPLCPDKIWASSKVLPNGKWLSMEKEFTVADAEGVYFDLTLMLPSGNVRVDDLCLKKISDGGNVAVFKEEFEAKLGRAWRTGEVKYDIAVGDNGNCLYAELDRQTSISRYVRDLVPGGRYILSVRYCVEKGENDFVARMRFGDKNGWFKATDWKAVEAFRIAGSVGMDGKSCLYAKVGEGRTEVISRWVKSEVLTSDNTYVLSFNYRRSTPGASPGIRILFKDAKGLTLTKKRINIAEQPQTPVAGVWLELADAFSLPPEADVKQGFEIAVFCSEGESWIDNLEVKAVKVDS